MQRDMAAYLPRGDKAQPDNAIDINDDLYFDDCPICMAEKKARATGKRMTRRELDSAARKLHYLKKRR